MEEQFIMRVPPSVAQRIERLLNDTSSSEDKNLDLSFSGWKKWHICYRKSPFLCIPIGSSNVLIKSADIGQMIMVREESDSVPESVEYRHGLTPPMRDARRPRFRREPDLNPKVVHSVEEDLRSIMAGGTAKNFGVEIAELEEYGEENARNTGKKVVCTPLAKLDVPEVGTVGGEPDGSDSDDSDDSI